MKLKLLVGSGGFACMDCASHFANIGSWKAGSHTSNSMLLKSQSQQLFVGLKQSHSTTDSTITVLPLIQTLYFSACDRFFSAAATKGWEWCNHDLMQRWRNVRGSQEAQASGREWRLCFYKTHGLCITFCEHRQLKGWQPHVQLTVTKVSISTIVRLFEAVT